MYAIEENIYDDGIIEMPKFPDVGEAIWALVEELYQTENDIREDRIDDAMQYLCNQVGIPESALNYQLQVVHWRKALPKSKLFEDFIGFTQDYVQTQKKDAITRSVQ